MQFAQTMLTPKISVRKNILMFLAVIMTAFQGNALNKAENSAKPDYADSIRNDGIVYSDHKAASLLKYLKELQGTMPEDSLRKYAAEGLINYNWYLMGKNQWFLCNKILEEANRLCFPSDSTSRHQIESAMAGTLLFCGKYADAGNMFLSANKYFQSTKDTVEWLKSCVNLGVYYSRTHNKPKALKYYGKVLKAAENKKYENYYSIVAGYAGNVEEDSIIGLNTLEKALRISQSNGYTFLLASNYNDLAKYYYRMENYHEAMSNARNALKYATKFNQDEVRITALDILADINYAQKNFVAAYDMESQKSSIIQSLQSEEDVKAYFRLKYIDSLLAWTNENIIIPDSISGRRHTVIHAESHNREILFAAIGFISALVIAAPIIIRHRKRQCGTSLASTEVSFHDSLPVKDLSLTEESHLYMIANGINPVIDRIRNELKEIPKTGNADTDAKIRNLYNRLLQSRLPNIESSVSIAVKGEQNKFTERLCATYPELTKNDLKMAVYVRSGLSLQEISVMSGLQSKSVNQARYRLRKALGLGKDDSLESFLMSF